MMTHELPLPMPSNDAHRLHLNLLLIAEIVRLLIVRPIFFLLHPPFCLYPVVACFLLVHMVVVSLLLIRPVVTCLIIPLSPMMCTPPFLSHTLIRVI